MTDQPYDRAPGDDTSVEGSEDISAAPDSADLEGLDHSVEAETRDETGGRGDPTP